jgi:hypothetical protein
VPVNKPVPPPTPAADADASPGASAGDSRAVRWLIAVLLFTAAALDLTRCGLVMATGLHPGPAGQLIAAGLAAAAISTWTARACLARRRWPTWAALLISAASAPQAAASGFTNPYTIPDTATAALAILLAVTILATAGPTRPEQHTNNCCTIDKEADR